LPSRSSENSCRGRASTGILGGWGDGVHQTARSARVQCRGAASADRLRAGFEEVAYSGPLKQAELPKSGTKEALRERLQEALDAGDLTDEELVEALDSVAPWGKQHVFLYQGPRTDIQAWNAPEYTQHLLKQHRLGKLFNARLPLVLPERLTLSSVTHLDGRLRVTAVEKRQYSERTPEHDEEKVTASGERVTLKAYVRHLTRTGVALMLDISPRIC